MVQAASTVIQLKSKAQRSTGTSVDTIMITPQSVLDWENPPFQRPLKVNAKVIALSEDIKAEGGVLPGIITIGILDGKQYLLDGQHRREAFIISAVSEGFTDVRYRRFESMADMGEEFVNLNSSLVRLRPDDILRGLEGTNPALQLVRKRATFVGYDMIRRGPKSPILGMSVTLRCWHGSTTETPVATAPSAATIAKTFTEEEATLCTDFLNIAEKAWGRDPEYARLWGGLNLTLTMWLYRRLVISPWSTKTPKLTKEQFRAALCSLSADASYLEWLVGRNMTERDRAPAYKKMKGIIAHRLTNELGTRPKLPDPPWLDFVR